MPARDMTGPEGKGPTGRQLGPCKGSNGKTVRPMRMGRGFGLGRGLMRKIKFGLNRQ